MFDNFKSMFQTTTDTNMRAYYIEYKEMNHDTDVEMRERLMDYIAVTIVSNMILVAILCCYSLKKCWNDKTIEKKPP